MRNITPLSLAMLEASSGVRPIIVVRVWWGGTTYTNYCDREFQADNLVGRLLTISRIEDVVDINANASSVTLSVMLDDSKGDIKAIYDNNDIHKTYVQIIQWFQGIPFSDAFPIFEGEIASPIVWSEGARTLSFNVMTKLESTEVGFAIEEGQFSMFPLSLIGKAWPVVFGAVNGVPMLSITDPPSAILSTGFGIVNDTLWNIELDALRASIALAALNQNNAYQLHLNNAHIAGAFKPFGGSLPDDPETAEQYDNAAQQYYVQAQQYGEERIKLTAQLEAKEAELARQHSLELNGAIPITATNLPTGYPILIEIENFTANAIVNGSTLALSNIVIKPTINQQYGTNSYDFGVKLSQYATKANEQQKFTWFDGGTSVRIFGLPRVYIASLGSVSVVNVWAQSKYGRDVVPRAWYTVSVKSFGSLVATVVTFPTPITSYPGEWQDGSITFDCISSLSPNTVDILLWAINNYSTLAYDAASFNYVRSKVAPFPMNFALLERKDIVQFLQEIAYQARCAIWINDRKFYLRFLPEELAPVDTLTDSDIEVESVTITSTETERLVTKYVASWRANSFQTEENKIIYRYNVKKYGTQEEDYSFYAFNQGPYVEQAAQFWMIRKSSSWKILKCKAHLHKLRIETFDPIAITFNEHLVANETVTGIVQQATFNPDDDTIDLEVWLPVRLGEMHKYTYAYPFDVTFVYPNYADPNIHTGNPFADANGELIPDILFPPTQQITYSRFNPWTQGRGKPIADASFETPLDNGGQVVVALAENPISTARPTGIATFNNADTFDIKPIELYNFKQALPATFPGTVIARDSVDGETQVYRVSVYFVGINNVPKTIEVTIPQLDKDSILPFGYPLMVTRVVYMRADGAALIPTVEFVAQPPIWYPKND